MICSNCGKKITGKNVERCPFCDEELVDLDKTIAINSLRKKETLENEIENVIEKNNNKKDEVIVVDGSIIQESSILDDITSDDSVKQRKRTLVISLGIAVCIMAIIGGIILLIPDSKENTYNYLSELEKGMKEVYNGNDSGKLKSVLEYVADDEKMLEEVQTQSNNIATKWVEEYKDKELDNSGSFKEAEEKYLSIINKIYELNVNNKDNDIIRLFKANDYNNLAKSIEKIYIDGKTYYEAIEYYHAKDYNNAYYLFGRVEVENTYYQKARLNQDKIVSDIMDILVRDIKKIELEMEGLPDSEILLKYRHIVNIIEGYESVYENVELPKKQAYKNVLEEYKGKVDYYTELVNNPPTPEPEPEPEPEEGE